VGALAGKVWGLGWEGVEGERVVDVEEEGMALGRMGLYINFTAGFLPKEHVMVCGRSHIALKYHDAQSSVDLTRGRS
jgi:hypothetical protein